MASPNGTLKYTYRGQTYTKELDPPDEGKISQYTSQILGENASSATSDQVAAARAQAQRQERQDRVTKAKNEVLQANAMQTQDDDNPNAMVPGGGVASGDPGISQRKTQDDATLNAATKDDKNATKTNVNTDDKQIASLPTLAEKLNKCAHQYPNTGFVTKAIAPSGDGDYLDQVADMAYQSAGLGNQLTQIGQVFRNIDRFERSMAPKNVEFAGYTFITRPRCNLRDANLAGDRRFSSMLTGVKTDTSYAIRCMLDSKFGAENGDDCPLFDGLNPFAVLLCNALTGISGFNDPILSTETTDGGYFQEDQTYAIGGDRMARTYDLTLTFKDYVGGPVSYAFDMWYQYMSDLMDGSMVQYADAIDANRMDYTVSIYRFILDRSKRIVTKWAKATGCFPVNAPTGVPFNKNQGESYISSNDNFGITFKANRIEYNDPIIMHEFNMLVRRYCPYITKGGSLQAYDYDAVNNFNGIPYIRFGEAGHELVFVRTAADNSSIIKANGNLSGTGLI